jgi:hypothetical protein
MAVHKRDTFAPVPLGHIRSHGCRDILIYCGSINCNHSTTARPIPGTDEPCYVSRRPIGYPKKFG